MIIPSCPDYLPSPLVTENSLRVLEKRYLGKDSEGKIYETPRDMLWRVAWNIAQAEKQYNQDETHIQKTAEEFYKLMSEWKFLPNSPTIMNAGRELQQLSACFVLPVPDSIPKIFETIKHQAIIHKTGGGTGFDFSEIRPKNDFVGSTGGVASGPISFMKIFNVATEQIKQGGTRRGANMAILRVDHPDILDFIDMKLKKTTTEVKIDEAWMPIIVAQSKGLDIEGKETRVIPGEMENFNVSVAITDEFMQAYRNDQPYNLIHPKTKKIVGQLNAKMVMEKIAKNAWDSGEPGLFFVERANATNPVSHIAKIASTNPCGEVDLLPYDSCNLGSIVLDNHLKHENGKYLIDWDALRQTIKTSVHFLDNTIDMNNFPLQEIRDRSNGTRRIGLGIMGFSRLLFKLEIPYDSNEGVQCAKEVMNFINSNAIIESQIIAKSRGPYGYWEGSIHQKNGVIPRRNSYVTVLAPTGTISMISDTSGGCEPEFSLVWYKNVMDGTHLPYVLTYFEEVAKKEGFYHDELMNDVLKNKGSPRGIARIPEKWQKIFGVAGDIDVEWHIKMQAAFQQYTESAVSKTLNLPKSATVDDVLKAYLMAYDLNTKGVTVYRDGSRQDQVLNLGTDKTTNDKTTRQQDPPKQKPFSRPQNLQGRTTKLNTGYGTLYATVNEENGKPVEIFAQIGKAGGYTASFTEAIARLVSLALQNGIAPEKIADQLEGIRSPRPGFTHLGRVYSIPDAIAKILVPPTTTEEEKPQETNPIIKRGDSPECPDCSTELVLQEGCVKCPGCGYSEC